MAYDKVVDSAHLDGALTAIADAIRGKTGGTELLTLADMAQGVGEVFNKGALSVFERMTSANHLFSDEGQNRYNEDIFDAFMAANLSNIKRAQYMFQGNIWLTEFIVPTTFRPILIHYMFQNCAAIKRVSGLDAVKTNVLTCVFDGCTQLEDAGGLDFERVAYVTNAFRNCTVLKHVTIVGTIKLSLDIHWSVELTRASIESIMEHLSTTTSGLSVTFSQDAVNNAFTTEEWTALADTRKNWTINLV